MQAYLQNACSKSRNTVPIFNTDNLYNGEIMVGGSESMDISFNICDNIMTTKNLIVHIL